MAKKFKTTTVVSPKSNEINLVNSTLNEAYILDVRRDAVIFTTDLFAKTKFGEMIKVNLEGNITDAAYYHCITEIYEFLKTGHLRGLEDYIAKAKAA